MFKKRKGLVAELVSQGRVIRFNDGYVIVPTESEVLQTISELLEGVVREPLTTLGVKNALRTKGFFATQSVVSEAMHSYASAHVLEAEDTGTYHVFSKGQLWVIGEALAAHGPFVH